MALVPDRLRGRRASIRFPVEPTPPESVSPSRLEFLADELDGEDEKPVATNAAEFARSEAYYVKRWEENLALKVADQETAEPMPVWGHFMELPKSRGKPEYWRRKKASPPRGDTPRHISHSARGAEDVYLVLSRMVQASTDSRKKTGSIIGDLTTYFARIESTNPHSLRDAGLITGLAKTILAADTQMKEHDRYTRARFLEVTGLIERHVPGIKHTYTILGREAPAEIPSNGHIESASELKLSQPFIYRPPQGHKNGLAHQGVHLKPAAPVSSYDFDSSARTAQAIADAMRTVDSIGVAVPAMPSRAHRRFF